MCPLPAWHWLDEAIHLGKKICEGATRVQLVTSRSVVECSATELYPLMGLCFTQQHWVIHQIIIIATIRGRLYKEIMCQEVTKIYCLRIPYQPDIDSPSINDILFKTIHLTKRYVRGQPEGSSSVSHHWVIYLISIIQHFLAVYIGK